jgi:hypothetical protein|tara:strand:+ start:302 stop:586 length:285 start_codon:yes stop_codon:yes gene_type:complete
MATDGLYANIHKKRARIASGSGETMRKPGSSGAPTDKAFTRSAKTAKGNNKMPMGKGTYGSQKGRPPAQPKNKMVAALANRDKKKPMPMNMRKT